MQFSDFFNDQIKRLSSVLYKYQHREKNVIINDPDEFVKMIEERDPSLKGFFDMLYQSMNPSSKNSSTEISLKRKVMVLCYQIASLRNKHVSSVKNQIALYMSNTGTSTSGINTLANLGIASTYKTVSRKKNEILLNHEDGVFKYLNTKINSLIIYLIDDYHDIHQSRNPIDENLSNVAHMATTMIYTPNVLPLPYISPLDEQVHNPMNVDVDLVSWALQFEYMSKLGISYIYQKSSWFCIADSSKFTEEETINFLTVHSYDPDFQITHPEHKKLKLLKLFDFIPQELKSLDNYLQAIYPFINSPVLSDYLSENIIPVPADYPGQYYLRKAITLRRRYGDSSNIPEKILHLVPLLGPLHVSLNTRETTIKMYYQFFNIFYKEVFKKRKNLPKKPQPWMTDLLLYLAHSGWMIIRKTILRKFKNNKDIEYRTFLDLFDNIIPACLDVYTILFREGHFDEYISTIFRLWSIMKRFERKNYNKIMLAFLSDVLYWQSIEHPMYNALKEHLSEFNEYFVENFHSLIQRYTASKNFNIETLRKDAINLDSNKHNSNFMDPFITKKNYPFKKKSLDNMVKKSALFLIEFFQKILTNLNTSKKIPKLDDKLYLFPTFNIEMKVATLPTGYCTNYLPSFDSCCDYENCEIADDYNDDNCILICGHEYHYQCLQNLQFKCQHCLDYLLNGIEYLGNLYNNRLESLDNTSILDEEDEEEDENTIDNEDNINLEGSEELILKGDLNLDQSLKNALYAFQQN